MNTTNNNDVCLKNEIVKVCDVNFSNDLPIVLIAGPCALESRDLALRVLDNLMTVTADLKIPFVFKSSFDKANRTSLGAKRGVPIDKAIEIFAEIKSTYKCPIITDVHDISHCDMFAEVVDILQIPAFLCRQTDLLVAAAKTNKAINIKKGQFLSPWDMENVYKKVLHSGNNQIMLCERGACFGYNRLVSDMRSLRIMSDFGYPVIFDATHSVQEPGGLGGASGGNREYVELLTRAAVSVGVAGIFVETHPDPNNAFSDGPNMVPTHAMKDFLKNIKEFDAISKSMKYISMVC